MGSLILHLACAVGAVGGSVVVGDGGEVDAEGGGVFVHGRRASKTTMNDNAMAVGQIM